jgi:hypothetical protein
MKFSKIAVISVISALLGISSAAFAGTETATGSGMTEADACNTAMSVAAGKHFNPSAVSPSSQSCGQCAKAQTTGMWSCVGYVIYSDK